MVSRRSEAGRLVAEREVRHCVGVALYRLMKCGLVYKAISHDIQITVMPEFLPDQSDADEERFFWAYTIEIVNLGQRTVQLMSRHWRITDARGRVEEVRGPGVVGEQPILAPGGSFRYTSGCPLTTASGIMVGTYRFVDEAGRSFEAEIPAFSLDSPHAARVLN